MQTLIIDHYDSFTYNLYQLIAEIQGKEPLVIAHDSDLFAHYDPAEYDNIVLSPGPGHPDNPRDFKLGKDIILHSDKPILGICLGHQGIFSAFGGRVARAPLPVHGCVSTIFHQNDSLYRHIPNAFQAMRYHSLVCTGSIPSALEITAWTEASLIMGLRHREKPIWGIQYHPESISSEFGHQLFLNFQQLTLQYYQKRRLQLPSKMQSLQSRDLTPIYKRNINPRKKLTLLAHKQTFSGNPADVFQALFASYSTAIWLDSSQIIPGFSRYSYMGALEGPLAYLVTYDTKTQTTTCHYPSHTLQHNMSIFTFLKQTLQELDLVTLQALPFDFQGGFMGYLGYELKQETTPVLNTKQTPHPDAQWLFLDRYLVFDHQEQTCYVVALTSTEDQALNQNWIQSTQEKLSFIQAEPLNAKVTRAVQGQWIQSPNEYKTRIQTCLDHINAGESYEICLTNKLEFPYTIDPWRFYLYLRDCHPAPHAAFFKLADLTIACSSMERFLKINQHRQIEAKPIKGTLPREATLEQDQQACYALQNNIKFRSEHLMIVDLLRNDLGKISQIGSIQVPEFLQVETYATVHQLISRITGQLRPEIDAIDCILQCFPGGSMTGAPKIRTMALLNDLETQARGIYSGSLGYISLNGTMDLNIVIRTAEITPQKVSIGAGGAIVALSEVEEEFEEMVLKTRALQTALGML